MRESPPTTTGEMPLPPMSSDSESRQLQVISELLLAEAVRAPSGDNLQPWRIVVDPGGALRIALYVDEARDPTPMNAGQRMSCLAVGAVLENLLRAAKCTGWAAELEEPSDSALAVVRLEGTARSEKKTDPTIAARVTNRRRYDGRQMPSEVLTRLQHQVEEFPGVRTHWIVDRHRISSFATLVGRSDMALFGEPSMRLAFRETVRFDQPWDAEVAEGLPVASLEVSTSERLGLRIMPYIPDWLLKLTGALRGFGATGRKLVESASGLCLIVEEDDTRHTKLRAGRTMQQAWLAMTECGLAAQPMMSLPVFENILAHGTPDSFSALNRDEIQALIDELHTIAPEIGEGRSSVLMRFGYAAAPSGRTGRLDPREVTTIQKAPSSGTQTATR